MTAQKGNILPVILVILATVALVSGIFWWRSSVSISQKACTLEAKLCPDGSSVGRSGPNCEFAACPTSTDKTAHWKTYTNSAMNLSVKYPPDKLFQISGDQTKSVSFITPNTGYGFTVTVKDNPDYLSPIFWLNKNFHLLYKNVRIDGRPVALSDIKTVDTGSGGGPAIEVTGENLPSFVLIGHPYKDKIYWVDGSTLEPDLFKLILDTIRI